MALLKRTVDCLEFSKLVCEINVHENRIGDAFGERLHPPKNARFFKDNTTLQPEQRRWFLGNLFNILFWMSYCFRGEGSD
jgi:hypothetical protein